MPAPTLSEHDAAVAEAILTKVFRKSFETDTARRPIHSRALLVEGTFTPSADARKYSIAPHFQKSTPILVRLSNSGGPYDAPDGDKAKTNPKGMAIRFDLGNKAHTDVILQNNPFFPAKNPDEFLGFFMAIGAAAAGNSDAFPNFLKDPAHRGARQSFEAGKTPTFPVSFATAKWFSVNAFKLVDINGAKTIFKYEAVPDAGEKNREEKDWKQMPQHWLIEDAKACLEKGEKMGFTLSAKLPNEGDTSNDATDLWGWPTANHRMITLGHISLEKPVANTDAQEKPMNFDPWPEVEGVEPSDDPLIAFRSNVYRISGDKRRAK